MLEGTNLASPADEFGQFYDAKVKGVKSDFVRLENGAEALFIRSGDLAIDKRHPMLVFIHGGPFSSTKF